MIISLLGQYGSDCNSHSGTKYCGAASLRRGGYCIIEPGLYANGFLRGPNTSHSSTGTYLDNINVMAARTQNIPSILQVIIIIIFSTACM